MSLFESYERRIPQIEKVLAQYGIKSLEEAQKIGLEKGIDAYKIPKDIQPICFENVCWAYVLGTAIAIKKVAPKPPTPPRPSARASRPSAFLGPSPTTEKSASVTETWPPCS